MAKLQSGTRIYGTANVDSSLAVGGILYAPGNVASTSNTTGTIVVTGGIGATGNVNANNVYVKNDLFVGTVDGNPLGGTTNPIIAAIGNTDNYIQTYQINYANTANASSDFIAYPNNGNDSNGWIDMGITSNLFSQVTYSVTGRNEGYIFMSAPGGSGTSGNLVIATDSTGLYNSIEFVVGGFGKGKTNSNVKFTTATTSTSNTTGSLVVSGGVGVTGNVYASGIVSANNVYATTLVDKYASPSISTNTLTLDLNTGSVFNVSLNANITTLTLQNIPSAGNIAFFVLLFTADGTARSVTWPASVRWADGQPPSISSTLNKRDVFTFFSVDAGTTWNAIISGQGI